MFKLAAEVFTIQTCNVASNDLELALLFANEISTPPYNRSLQYVTKFCFAPRHFPFCFKRLPTTCSPSSVADFYYCSRYVVRIVVQQKRNNKSKSLEESQRRGWSMLSWLPGDNKLYYRNKWDCKQSYIV